MAPPFVAGCASPASLLRARRRRRSGLRRTDYCAPPTTGASPVRGRSWRRGS